MCLLSVVAMQGGLARWSVSVMSVILVACLIFTFIVWRQPQDKAKLAFKVQYGGLFLQRVVSHSDL